MKVTNAKQPIVLENVHFEYNEEEQVLKNIDFTIESGKVTAIVVVVVGKQRYSHYWNVL